MDPLRSLILDHLGQSTSSSSRQRATWNTSSNVLQQNGCIKNSNICVEESIDCREAGSRFFRLTNYESGLSIILSKDSDFVSCKLAGRHEIVVDKRLYTQNHATWAIGDRPYQKLASLPWNCHVRNPELLLSTANNSSSIVYELTRLNELNSLVKLKSIHLQHQVTYFNLNNAKEKSSIDGHTLIVQCNGNTNKIQAQSTKLLCHCNKSSSILPQSLIGEIPFELVQHDASMYISTDSLQRRQPPSAGRKNAHNRYQESQPRHPDDIIVCDSVYSLESTGPMDMLSVKLQYNDRSLTFELRPAASSNHASSPGHKNSNTRAPMYGAASQPTSRDTNHQHQTLSASSSSFPTGESPGKSVAESEQRPQSWLGSLIESPSLGREADHCQPKPPTETNEEGDSSNNLLDEAKSPENRLISSQQPMTILRARVRVTNFGVCIMPLMMTNYVCKYRFLW